MTKTNSLTTDILTVSSEVMAQDGQDCTYTQILTKESSHEPQQGLETKTDYQS